MFNRHVSKWLSAYRDGELAPKQSRRVAEHLLRCERCRGEYEGIKLGARLSRQLTPLAAPDDMWGQIEAALESRAAAAPGARPAPEKFSFAKSLAAGLASLSRSRAALACMVLVVALVGAAYWRYLRPPSAPWEVVSIAGSPIIDSDRIGQTGSLGVGEWLETDDSSRAQISVANIGQVDVEPNTRVRLLRTEMTEHRLQLERGTMHARIYAPPRLFFVETPSATAIDYGCAYTLEVDDAGASSLHVTLGLVALELNGRESIVPAGAACETRPGVGPGTPYFEDASDPLKSALALFDFGGGADAALKTVLAESRHFDTLTLWHLLARAGESQRGMIYDRMAALSPPPGGVTREGVISLDEKMLDRWRDELELYWFREDVPVWKKAWRNMWGG